MFPDVGDAWESTVSPVDTSNRSATGNEEGDQAYERIRLWHRDAVQGVGS